MQSMPMQTRTLVSEHVVHVHDDSVSKVDFDGWAGPLVVDADDVAFESVGRGAYPGYVPVVDYGFGEGEVGPGQSEERKKTHLAAEDGGEAKEVVDGIR